MTPVKLKTAYNAAEGLDTYSVSVNPVCLSVKAEVDRKVFYVVSDLCDQLHIRLRIKLDAQSYDSSKA